MDNTQRVLVVDDDVISGMVTVKNLEKRGFLQTAQAKNGREALQIFADFNPDVVLMDMRLAGDLDGLQTTRELRKISKVPVIFFSATLDQAEIDQAKAISNSRFFDRFAPFDQVTATIKELTA